MRTSDALVALAEYTADQWGMVTTAQAKAAGVDSVTLYRLADNGEVHSVRRGVYAAATAPISQHREVQAAWLALNPTVPAWQRPRIDPDGGVVSHRTAAAVHGLGDMLMERIELTVPRRREMSDPLVQLRQPSARGLSDDDVVLVDGLPVTSAARTVEDLLDDHVDAGHVADVVKDAYRAGKLELADLDARIGRYARRYGIKSRDGADLIDGLLDQIGMSRDSLARQAVRGVARATLGELNVSGITPQLREAVRGLTLSPHVQRELAEMGRQLGSPRPYVTEALANAMSVLPRDQRELMERGVPASIAGLITLRERSRPETADDNAEAPTDDEST